MGHLLYKKAFSQVKNSDDSLKIERFVPKVGSLFLKGEKKDLRTALARLNFVLISGARAEIYYVTDSDFGVIHTSYVIPYCAKFSFMQKNDYEIGPCKTDDNFRGRGIYPAVLKYITSLEEYRHSIFYMIVSQNNTPSIRGIEKAGFERCGRVMKNRLSKQYRLIKEV